VQHPVDKKLFIFGPVFLLCSSSFHRQKYATILTAKGPENVQTLGAFAPLKLRCPRPRLEVPIETIAVFFSGDIR